MQIPFGGEQPLHQRCGTTPQDRMTGQDQFMSHCGQGVTFPDAWFPHGDHIDGCLQKGSALEPFQLEFQGWAKMGFSICGTALASDGDTRSRTASKVGSFPASKSNVRAVSTSDSDVLAARCKIRT